MTIAPKVCAVTLENGLKLLVVENPTADIVAVRLFVRFGGRYEASHQAGLSQLLASVLTKGTDQLNAFEIAEQVESVGAGLSADATADYFLVGLKTVSADFTRLLALMAQIVRSPSFRETEVDLERNLTLQLIRSQLEQPLTIAFNQLRQAMYQTHPYAFSSAGTLETVVQLQPQDLHLAHQTYFRPDNTVISIAGRITLDEAIACVKTVFGDWQPPTPSIPPLQFHPITAVPKTLVTSQETQQMIVMLGHLAAPVQGEILDRPTDYACLKLLSTHLGNGLSSRLFVELREKQGLAYEVAALYPTRLDPASFVVYLGTAPENGAIALENLQAELHRLCTTPLSSDELQVAKNKILGQYSLGKQTNGQIAQVFGWYETLGLGVDFDQQFQQDIEAATVEKCQEVACRYFQDPFVSLVGPAAALPT